MPAATTAFGKTVVAASLIAERGCGTLILVHRRELLGQWTERLKQFLSQAERRGFEHRVQVRVTDFQLPTHLQGQERVPMPELYAALAADEARNTLIFDDVLAALEAGRYPLVLTERRDHLEGLRMRFEKFAKNVMVLRGGMGSRERRLAEEVLRVPEPEERLVLSTGRFLGEGFDASRLHTSFLVSPISWKGTLAQYVGRLHREHEGKGEVRVYDYMECEYSGTCAYGGEEAGRIQGSRVHD